MAIVSEILETAKAWRAAGFSILPIGPNKKTTLSSWGRFQNEIPSEAYLDAWFGDNPGLALVCGKVSGNLEMLELEDRAITPETLARINAGMREAGAEEVWDDLQVDHYFQQSPSGGVHFLYRILDNPVPGNTPVARRPSTPQELEQNPGKFKVLAETRGEGGYFIIAPSGGPVHPSGRPWVALAGTPGDVKSLTWDERNAIHAVIYGVLDEMPPAPAWEPKQYETHNSDELRPGDDFNNQARWDDILEPEGWTRFPRPGSRGETLWTRPGKRTSQGASASTGYTNDGDRLYVFSSSTEFETERPYDKFSAYALIHHRGDLAAAASTLRKQGYGSPRVSAPVSNPAPKGWTPVFDGMVVDPASAQKVPNAKAAMTSNLIKVNQEGQDWVSPSVDPSRFEFMVQTDTALAQAFSADFHTSFQVINSKEWMFFDGKVWRADTRSRHMNALARYLDLMLKVAKDIESDELEKFARKVTASTKVSAMSKLIASEPQMGSDYDDFDSQRNYVTVENGVLDLETGKLGDFDPKLMLTRKFGAKFDPQAKAPRWERFMEEVLPDKQMRDYVQRALGYTMTGSADNRAMFVVHGPSGTGKSQFFNAIGQVFGDFGADAAPDTFRRKDAGNGPSTNLHALRGARFAALTELDVNESFDEALLKKVTGHDPVTTRELYQAPQTWVPEFVAWIATNHLPKFSSDDNAIWKRVKPIAFSRVFDDDGAQTERDLGTWMAQNEASGILNWLLEGLAMYCKDGLAEPESLRQGVEDYRLEVDAAAQFISEAADDGIIKVESTKQVGVRQLHMIYSEWCHRNGIRPLGERRFNQRVESLGFVKQKTESMNMWVGIGVGSHGFLGTFDRSSYPSRS